MHFAYLFLCGGWKTRLTHQYIPASVKSWPQSCDEDFAKDTSTAMYFISPFFLILSLSFPLLHSVQICPLFGKSSWCPAFPSNICISMKALTRFQQLTYFLSPPCSHSYYVMQSCWALDSRRRPSFSQLVSSLACQLVEAEGAVSKHRKEKNLIFGEDP